ncbi:hypothetical protein [Streptomyces sp. NPDC058657]|uniref:hypothetical protein n=1 Tax=unclassified Streptomyces TaxID=2593676 RepID=UPI003651D53A
MSTPVSAATAWLAAADPDPDHAARWLGSTTIVVLPTGRSFDAVKVPEHVGRRVQKAGVDGPVISDPAGQTMFFLVPPGTASRWEPTGDAVCLGLNSYLTVPVPEVTAAPGPHWIQPPAEEGQLVDPALLADLLRTVGEAS